MARRISVRSRLACVGARVLERSASSVSASIPSASSRRPPPPGARLAQDAVAPRTKERRAHPADPRLGPARIARGRVEQAKMPRHAATERDRPDPLRRAAPEHAREILGAGVGHAIDRCVDIGPEGRRRAGRDIGSRKRAGIAKLVERDLLDRLAKTDGDQR